MNTHARRTVIIFDRCGVSTLMTTQHVPLPDHVQLQRPRGQQWAVIQFYHAGCGIYFELEPAA